MAQQPMRQFIQPDFDAPAQPRLDWMPWEQAPAQGQPKLGGDDEEGGGIKDAAKMAGTALGAASL